MNTLWQSTLLTALTAVILGAGVQPAAAAKPILYGTTGACNSSKPGDACTQTSELVQLDPSTGELISYIGPIGYTVTGLAWDNKSKKLYASTSIGCGLDGSVCPFHGLITIDPATGAGTPVNPAAGNFGLDGNSPIHSISMDAAGRMVAWYDERPAPGVTDTFVKIDKTTGIATEFPDTGIDTSANGLSFDQGNNQLWNIDTARRASLDGPLTQTAYILNPANGKQIGSIALSPPTMAALGDFNPVNKRYYGLKFTSFGLPTTFIVVVNIRNGTVTTLGPTVDGLHTLAFAK